MTDTKAFIGFLIAQRHVAAVVKYREGSFDRYDLEYELKTIKELADANGIPYVIPTNFLAIIQEEDQYQYEEESSEYPEEESSEYY